MSAMSAPVADFRSLDDGLSDDNLSGALAICPAVTSNIRSARK